MSESSTDLLQTPLHDAHVGLGARMSGFAGWDMPLWYSNAVEEHHAVRKAAGLFDLSHMAELFVTGDDAGAALDRALLLHASGMDVGRARYTMICNAEGGIVDDLIVYRLDTDEYLVVANASNRAAVTASLTDVLADFDASLEDRTEQMALIAVQGPIADALCAELISDELHELKYYRAFRVEDLLVARTGYTGERGFELFMPADHAEGWWERLLETGASQGLVPVGLAARDTLRLEAGMPLYGQELTIDTTPFDVGSARLVPEVDAKPGWYVGSAALAEARSGEHQRLVGLLPDGRRPARTGYPVSLDGVAVGAITSGTLSPTLECLVAIARVRADVTPGDRVQIEVRGNETDATVTELPFYKRGTR